MAKIHEEIIVIKLSKLIKESDSSVDSIVTEDLLSSLSGVAEELAGKGIIVEAEKA